MLDPSRLQEAHRSSVTALKHLICGTEVSKLDVKGQDSFALITIFWLKGMYIEYFRGYYNILKIFYKN